MCEQLLVEVVSAIRRMITAAGGGVGRASPRGCHMWKEEAPMHLHLQTLLDLNSWFKNFIWWL